jgi:hypothetical protein
MSPDTCTVFIFVIEKRADNRRAGQQCLRLLRRLWQEGEQETLLGKALKEESRRIDNRRRCLREAWKRTAVLMVQAEDNSKLDHTRCQVL